MKKWLLFLLFTLISLPAMASEPLKIGLLLIEDSVPFYVAEQEKYYAHENIQVELIPFLSALERDSALAAGAIALLTVAVNFVVDWMLHKSSGLKE